MSFSEARMECNQIDAISVRDHVVTFPASMASSKMIFNAAMDQV